MDWKQFIADIISNLAWPSVAIAFLFMFRAELAKIVQRLAHVKYKDLELDFEKVKQQAEELHIEFAQEEPVVESPVFTSLEEQMMDAVDRAPSAAILLAWSGLETSIASAVSRLAISPDSPSYRSPMHNIETLSKNGRLSKKHESLLHEMRMLRNKVAHEKDSMLSISQSQALSYVNAAVELIRHFEKYQRNG
ncbi:hypothetical protein GCM10011352_23830 [Marinobacterium zhoushanense]|uniref:DUF4145 domain-containing protein n=1 Tax=Marinobacterium zhoushanense TaxID=1679163 RepID=A0ABQ1KI03_9GAMM|nr:DUF4145 domain-containing protein [Marinobacterium zhoushanense]GGB96922.1 hypothetical protein GCM10011352_23830 [Marinobacterium zhoushanense]